MENDLKGNENYFDLTGGSSYRGLDCKEIKVKRETTTRRRREVHLRNLYTLRQHRFKSITI